MGIAPGFLTRRPTSRPGVLWAVTYYPPAIARVGKTENLDVYVAIGDGFGQHCVPYSTVKRLWGEVDVPALKPLAIRMIGDVAGGDGYPTHLSRRASGRYMITEHVPIRLPIDGEDDLFPQPGDGLYCGDFCEWFAGAVWSLELEPLETRLVSMRGELRESI